MERKRVSSSAISSVGYDAASRLLEVKFRHGAVYDYHGVPPELYGSLLAAPSIGRFFSENIRGQFSMTRPGGESR